MSDITIKNEALIKAVKEENLKQIEELIEAGADPFYKNKQGESALDFVFPEGLPGGGPTLQKLALLKPLLKKLDKDKIKDHYILLKFIHHAIGERHHEMVEYLLKLDPSLLTLKDPNFKTDKYSWAKSYNPVKTILYKAITRGWLNSVQVILKQYASHDEALLALRETNPENGITALTSAMISGHHEILNFIFSQFPMLEQEVLKTLTEKIVSSGDDRNFSAISLVIIRGRAEDLKFILNKYPNPREILLKILQEKSQERGFALHYAISEGYKEMVKYIFELLSKEEVLKILREKNLEGKTALYMAIESGKIDMVKLILSQYPNHTEILKALELRKGDAGDIIEGYHYEHTLDGRTAVHRAMQESVEMAELILSYYPQSEMRRMCSLTDAQERTSLDFAVILGNKEVIRLLLSKGGFFSEDVTAERSYLRAPFIPKIIRLWGYKELKVLQDELNRLIQDLGTAVNARSLSRQGNTALHLALEDNNKALFFNLIKAGANPTLENDNKQTVENLAKKHDHPFYDSVLSFLKIKELEKEWKTAREKVENIGSINLHELFQREQELIQKENESKDLKDTIEFTGWKSESKDLKDKAEAQIRRDKAEAQIREEKVKTEDAKVLEENLARIEESYKKSLEDASLHFNRIKGNISELPQETQDNILFSIVDILAPLDQDGNPLPVLDPVVAYQALMSIDKNSPRFKEVNKRFYYLLLGDLVLIPEGNSVVPVLRETLSDEINKRLSKESKGKESKNTQEKQILSLDEDEEDFKSENKPQAERSQIQGLEESSLSPSEMLEQEIEVFTLKQKIMFLWEFDPKAPELGNYFAEYVYGLKSGIALGKEGANIHSKILSSPKSVSFETLMYILDLERENADLRKKLGLLVQPTAVTTPSTASLPPSSTSSSTLTHLYQLSKKPKPRKPKDKPAAHPKKE